jgi:hypothetical protein
MNEASAQRSEILDDKISKKSWTVTIDGDRCRISSLDGAETHVIDKANVPAHLDFVVGKGRIIAVLRDRSPARLLGIDEAAYGLLMGWRGPLDLRDLKWELQLAFKFSLPLGLFLCYQAISKAYSGGSFDSEHLDYVSLSLGLGLAFNSCYAKYRPSPSLLLVESITCAFMAIDTGYLVYIGMSPWFAVLAAFQLALAKMRYGAYSRLRHVR